MKQLCSVFALLCCLPGLSAQEVKEVKEEEKSSEVKGRVAWVVYTSMPEGVENPVKILAGEEISEVTLSKRSPSVPVKVPADGILRIVKKVEPPPEAGKPAYHTLAQALVPEGVDRALWILTPAEENPQRLLFQSKVVNLAEFKGGTWLFLNTSPRKVGIDLGGKKLEIAPGESKVLGDGAQSEPTNMTIRYFFEDPKKSEWKILSASTVVIYPTRREICIFGWDPRFKRMNYHGITFPVTE